MRSKQKDPGGVKRSFDFGILLLILAALFGGYVRIYPVVQAGFPLLDGGLFYTMTRDLVDAGLRLPWVTSYNHLNIPFAYPPLPFYLVGVLNILTGLDLLGLIRWCEYGGMK